MLVYGTIDLSEEHVHCGVKKDYVICQNFAFVISLCVSKLCYVLQHVEFLHRMYMLKRKANVNIASLREYEMEAYVVSKWSHFFLIINKDIKFALNV